MDKQPHGAAVDRALKEMARIAEEPIIPQMLKSAFVLAYADSEMNVDVWLALQVGFAVMFEKPLIVMTREDYALPPRLLAVADEIVKIKSVRDPDIKAKLKAAVDRVLGKLGS